jgi:hypothetical protein
LGAALAHADGAGAAPKTLAAMPGEGVWFAGFAHAGPSSDALVQPWQQAALQLVEAAAIDFAWPAKDKANALEIVRLLFPHVVDSVGVMGTPKGPTVVTSEADLWGDAKEVARFLKKSAFTISEADRDAKPSLDLAAAIAAFASKPGFAAMLKGLTNDKLSIKVTTKPITSKSLPKGSFGEAYELQLFDLRKKSDPVEVVAPGQPPPPPPPPTVKKPTTEKPKDTLLGKLTACNFVIPDGPRTWVGWSKNEPSEDALARLLSAVKGNSPLTLAQGSPAGYAFMTAQNASSASIFTLEGFARSLVPDPDDLAQFLSKLPDGGSAPLGTRTTATKVGSGGTAELAALLPRDVVALVGELINR